jgi:hypothetical protein
MWTILQSIKVKSSETSEAWRENGLRLNQDQGKCYDESNKERCEDSKKESNDLKKCETTEQKSLSEEPETVVRILAENVPTIQMNIDQIPTTRFQTSKRFWLRTYQIHGFLASDLIHFPIYLFDN